MKNFILLSLTFLMISCIYSCNDRNEGNVITGTARVKIDSVKIAQDTMDVLTTQTIKTFSDYRKNCEGFYGYDYLHTESLTRTVSAYLFTTDGICEEQYPRASFINFRPQEKGDYKFKFWSGTDTADADIWIEKSIHVQ